MGTFISDSASWVQLGLSVAAAVVLWLYLWQVFWPMIRKNAGLEPDYERRAEELMQSYRQRRRNGTDKQT